ncbi:MAG: nucleotidyltransferase domain-containing protein [Candidatus Sumerlaeota bacterium]|nr:nucleotidyltransferase domain-containing protein [Candidatus Sumerlaeota bacterium]
MRANARQLKEIVRRIVEVAHPLRIILFGSAARGEMTKDSDVDLMVVMPPGTHRRHTGMKLYPLMKGIMIPVDIVVATELDLIKHKDTIGLVYGEALRDGKEIYGSR